MVAKRDDELGLDGALPMRILTSIGHLRQFEGYHGIDVRVHTTALYCSLYHADDEMLVTPHVYGRPGRRDTPILHLRHREQHGIFDSYVYHFDDVFEKAAARSGRLSAQCGTTRPAPGRRVPRRASMVSQVGRRTSDLACATLRGQRHCTSFQALSTGSSGRRAARAGRPWSTVFAARPGAAQGLLGRL